MRINSLNIGKSRGPLLCAIAASAPDAGGDSRLFPDPSWILKKNELQKLVSLFREKLPLSNGSFFSDSYLQKKANDAVNQCIALRIGGNRDWLEDKSIKNLLILLSYLYGIETRRLDARLLETHAIAVAHRTNNHPNLKEKYGATYITFCALAHDALEDVSPKRDKETDRLVMELVAACWEGPKSFLPKIEKVLTLLTDPFWITQVSKADGKHEKRQSNQIQCAKNMGTFPPSIGEVAATIRLWDKFSSYFGDLLDMWTGKLSERAMRDSFKKAWGKRRIVNNLPIPQEFKNYYRQMLREIGQEIRRIAPNSTPNRPQNSEKLIHRDPKGNSPSPGESC